MGGPIALVDCNNFYTSCERLFQPEERDAADRGRCRRSTQSFDGSETRKGPAAAEAETVPVRV